MNINKNKIPDFQTLMLPMFFYSHNSENVRTKNLNNIFINDNLLIDSTIWVDANKPIFIAEFGSIEGDTTKYFSHSSYETNGNWNLKKVNHYHGGMNLRFRALLIKDHNFIQLQEPFPYYTRAIFKSIKRHPEEALLLAPILPFQHWTYVKVVEKMDNKLFKHLKVTLRKRK